MPGAPPPMQFAPLSFSQPSQGNSLGSQLQALGKAAGPLATAAGGMGGMGGALTPGSAIPGAEGMTSVGGPNGPMPVVAPGTVAPAAPNPGQAGSMQAGPLAPGQQFSAPQPSILDALKGMQPPQIMDVLRRMSSQGQSIQPPGMPGSAALSSAGLLPSYGGG
jgi:hypothetical protein